MIVEKLIDSTGHAAELSHATRLLEKTPKNALRVPFLNRAFPDAQFVFLWREPRGNLSSMLEAWRSGRWKTYNGLTGFEGPWSLILPPGWPSMNGEPLERIAAFQWETTNRLAMDDLAELPSRRWTSASYEELVKSPMATVERLCDFLDIDMDEALRARLARPLPPSRQTHTPPMDGKWRNNADLIEPLMPQLQTTWRRLAALRPVRDRQSDTGASQ